MTADIAAAEPPEGFEPQLGRGPFTMHNGPFFHRACEDGVEHGFRVSARHCNGVGLLHGGMIGAFFDGLLASAVGQAARGPAVTINLSINYLDVGRSGNWVTGRARVTRLTRDLAFVEGVMSVGDRDLARASAVFKRIDKSASARPV